MQNTIREMVELQNKLNIDTNGSNWILGFTNQNRSINWFRCIYMEAAEAIDSLNWKHWKNLNGIEDFKNVEIELVDIWHFILSEAIVEFGIEGAISYFEEHYVAFIKNKQNNFQNYILLNELENILVSAANKKIPIVSFYRAVEALDNFNAKKIRSLYIGKNCLNGFRQDNGYKEGTYIKIWDNIEDNVYMQKIIEVNPDISYLELYNQLKELYQTRL